MKVYFIVPSQDVLPTKEQIVSIEEEGVKVETIIHKGKLATLPQLQEDTEEKILAVEPDSFDWEFDAETLEKIPKVIGVCTATTSFDWIKPDQLKKFGIKGINAPGFSKDSAAEYAVCMAIDTARYLPMVIKNGWKPISPIQPFVLKGKKAGVIGLGRIGHRMAEILQGIGMEVLYWSRSERDQRFKFVELDDLFKEVDVLMPALVENEETKKIITKERIDMIKPTSILVGISRVKMLWDEKYIIEKVEKGTLGGYAFEGGNNKPLETYKGNIWALPEIAWATHDSIENLTQIWVDNIKALIKGRPQNVITS